MSEEEVIDINKKDEKLKQLELKDERKELLELFVRKLNSPILPSSIPNKSIGHTKLIEEPIEEGISKVEQLTRIAKHSDVPKYSDVPKDSDDLKDSDSRSYEKAEIWSKVYNVKTSKKKKKKVNKPCNKTVNIPFIQSKSSEKKRSKAKNYERSNIVGLKRYQEKNQLQQEDDAEENEESSSSINKGSKKRTEPRKSGKKSVITPAKTELIIKWYNKQPSNTMTRESLKNKILEIVDDEKFKCSSWSIWNFLRLNTQVKIPNSKKKR